MTQKYNQFRSICQIHDLSNEIEINNLIERTF
jgi:hypothetical protein